MVLLASDFDKSKYLRAEDIKQERKFRIKAVTEEMFERDGGKEKKLVLWFTNDERGLVLNKTNNRTLRGAFGDDTANWIGKVIVVFPVMAEFRGKMTPGLRVRIPPPKQATEQAAAPQQPVRPAMVRRQQRCGSCCSSACRGGTSSCGSGAATGSGEAV